MRGEGTRNVVGVDIGQRNDHTSLEKLLTITDRYRLPRGFITKSPMMYIVMSSSEASVGNFLIGVSRFLLRALYLEHARQ